MAMPRLDPNNETSTFVVRGPASFWAQVRQEAARRGEPSVSALVRRLLEEWLAQAPPAEARKRKRP